METRLVFGVVLMSACLTLFFWASWKDCEKHPVGHGSPLFLLLAIVAIAGIFFSLQYFPKAGQWPLHIFHTG